MLRISILPLCLFMLASHSLQPSAIKPGEDLVDWSPWHKLQWSDYKGSPDSNSDAAASTTTIVGVEYKIGRTDFSFSIHCRFSREKSWGLHKTSYILQHEQGHFDIAEVYARKLNKALSEYKFNYRTYNRDLNQIYNRVMREKENMQNQYDRETNHSIKKDKQIEWLGRIEQMLDETVAWSDY